MIHCIVVDCSLISYDIHHMIHCIVVDCSLISEENIIMDLKKQIQKLKSELVEANQQSLYQQQQHEQHLQSNNDRMKTNYDQQMEDILKSKQEGWQVEMKRMKEEYEHQLSAMNDTILKLQNNNTTVLAQVDKEKVMLLGTEERKAVIQDVYSSVCTYFDPDSDERDSIQYSTNDVLKRIRSALKSMM